MILKRSLIFILIVYFLLIPSFLSACKYELLKEEIDSVVIDEKMSVLKEEINYKTEADEKVDLLTKQYLENIELKEDIFLNLSRKDKELMIETVQVALEDFFAGKQPDSAIFLKKFDDVNKEVAVLLRIGGRKKGFGLAENNNLARAVYTAAIEAINDKTYKYLPEKKDLENIQIEIFILGNKLIFDEGYEKGIHGLCLSYPDKTLTYCNNIAAEGNYEIDRLLEKMCEEIGLKKDCYNQKDTSIFYFPTIHFGKAFYTSDIQDFYRCSVINKIPENNVDKIAESLKWAEKWLVDNLNEEGYFDYLYYPSNGNYSTSNNMIRQLMASRWLAEKCSRDLGNKELLALHKKNLDYIFKNWYREESGLGYIFFDKKSKLGAIAMAIRMLVYSPYFNEYRHEAEKLANTVLKLQDKSGDFKAWYIEPDYEYDEERLLRFYSGEAILSLVELYLKTKEKKYYDAVLLSEKYYIDYYRAKLDYGYFPAFIPWHTMAINKLYFISPSEEFSEAVFIFNDRLIDMQNTTGMPYIDYLGRFYDPDHPEYGVPHAASTGVYTEGLCYAYELAKAEGDMDRMYEYKKAMVLGAHNLMNLQYYGPDMYYLGHPERVVGAIRTSEDTNSIRIDNTQHCADAFTKYLELFK